MIMKRAPQAPPQDPRQRKRMKLEEGGLSLTTRDPTAEEQAEVVKVKLNSNPGREEVAFVQRAARAARQEVLTETDLKMMRRSLVETVVYDAAGADAVLCGLLKLPLEEAPTFTKELAAVLNDEIEDRLLQVKLLRVRLEKVIQDFEAALNAVGAAEAAVDAA